MSRFLPNNSRKSTLLISLLIGIAIVLSVLASFSLTSKHNVSAAVDPNLSIKACNLSFEDSIYIKYAVSGNELGDNVKLLVWTEPEEQYLYGSQKYILTSIETASVNGTACQIYQFTKLAAKQMTDIIYARAYVEINGVEYYSPVKKYSILQYAYNKLGKTGTATENVKLIDLLNNMLEYGASAQLYFGYKTNLLATDEFYKVTTINGLLPDGTDNGLYKAGTELTLNAPEGNADGFGFFFWQDEAGEIISTAQSVNVVVGTENRVYTAVYRNEFEGLYTVQFVDYDGTVLKTELVSENESATAPEPPEREGYRFLGWDYMFNCISEDMVITACYVKQYSVSFYDDDETTVLKTEYVDEGQDAVPPANPFKSGYRFAGWVGDYTNVTEDRVVVASYALIEGQLAYTINDDGTSCTVTGIGTYNGTVVEIPEYLDGYLVNAIGNRAFAEQTQIEGIIIPNTVETIGTRAFYSCSGISEITIPASVIDIGTQIFYKCTNLKTVYYNSMYAPANSTENMFLNNVNIEHLVLGCSIVSVNLIRFAGIADNTWIRDIEIADTVNSIEKGAFYFCTYLESMTLPFVGGTRTSNTFIGYIFDWSGYSSSSYNKNRFIPSSLKSITLTKEISDYAFYGCPYITSVTIDNGVTSIGSYAFDGCTGLTSVTISDSVTNIGAHAFSACKGLTRVTIPDSVTSIGSSAFSVCTGLTSVTIPDSVTNIGAYAFSGCAGLACITIGNGVTIISDSLFYNCTGLTSVTISDSVTNIGVYAFSDCTGLSTITIPNSVTCIGDDAFYCCTGLTSVMIPDSVTTIGKAAFRGCAGLACITIGNGVTIISDSLFYDCTGLTSVTIPDSVRTIEESAFYGCTGLTSVTIPDSVTCIGQSVFVNCTNLASVYYTGEIEQWLLIHFSYGGSNPCRYGADLFINTGMVENLTIPDCVSSISDYAFYGCKSLKNVTIPDSVTCIGEAAFYCCTGLTSVMIPDSVTNIGAYAFSGCTSLTSVTIPDSVSYVLRGTFNGCTGLTTITIPNSVTGIGSCAFYGCTGLTDILIPDSVTIIDREAFSGCTGLTSVTIPNSVTSIADYAFNGCTGLTSVTISDSVTNIGHAAFSGCTGLTTITIPNSVTDIGGSAFYGCTGLTDILIPDSVTIINMEAFYGCTSLEVIYYTGTEEQWNAVTLGKDWDKNTGAYNIVFDYNG